MPNIKTLRKYYPESTKTDEELLEAAEWVRQRSGKKHISPDNKILAAIIEIDEARKKIKSEAIE